MIKNNHGHIVALTSVAGLSGQKEQLPLSVSQFAVQGLAESLLEEFRINRKDNIHVTIIHIYPFILNSDTAADIRLRYVIHIFLKFETNKSLIENFNVIV